MAGSIKGITIEINGQTTKLQKALQDAGGATGKLKSELKSVEKGLKFDPSNTELLTQKQKILSESIAGTKSRLDVLNEAQRQMKERLGDTAEGSEEYRKLRREIVSAEKDLKKLEQTQSSFNVTMEQMSNKVGQFAQATEKAGNALKPVSAAASATVFATSKFASDFENAMAKVSTISDETQKPIIDLKKEIIALSNETGISSAEVANSVYDAISAGQDTAKAVDFVRTTNQLAVAGFTDIGKAVDVVTTTLNAYQLESEEATRVSDILIKTQNLGKVTVDELADSIGKVIPTANSFGVGIEQLGASYAILTANGIKSVDATSALNAMFTEMGTTGSKVDEILREKTGKSFEQLSSSGKNMVEILEIVKEGAAEAGGTLGDMFGSVAAKAAKTFETQGLEEYNAVLSEMQNAQGTTAEGFEKMQTTSMKVKIALNQIKNAGIEIGEAFLPIIVQVSEKVSEWAKKFSGLSDETKRLIAVLLGIASVAAPILLFVSKVAFFVQSLLAFLPTLFSIIKGIFVLLAANPIGIVVAAIGALIAYLVHLYKTNEEFREKVQAVWTGIQKVVGEAIEFIVGIFEEWIGYWVELYKTNEEFRNKVQEIWTTISNIFNTVGDVIFFILGGWMLKLQELYQKNEEFRAAVDAVWQFVGDAIKFAIDAILFVIGGWILKLAELYQKNEEFRATVDAVWQFVSGAIKFAINTVLFAIGGWILKLAELYQTNERFRTIVQAVWQFVSGAIGGAIRIIVGFIAELGNNIRIVSETIYNAFTTLPGKMIAAGGDLVRGLWKGIADKTGWIIHQIQGFTSNVLAKIKSFFGIQSPSKIMRDDVGKMLVAGIVVGVEQEQKKLYKSIGELSRKAIASAKENATDYKEIGTLYLEEMNNGLKEKGEQSADIIDSIIDNTIEKFKKKNKKASKEYEKAGAEVSKAYKAAIVDGIKGIQEQINEEIKRITEEAQKQYDDILRKQESLSKKLADFGDLYVVDPETNEIVIESIEKQIDAIERYGNVLDSIKGKGVSNEFLDEITKLGVDEGTRFGESLLKLSDEQFKQYHESWTKKQELAKEVASKFYKEQLETLEKDFVQRLDSSLATVPSLVENVGVNAIQGMIDGMSSKQGEAIGKARDIANAVIAEMQRAMDIHSPSRVMRDLVGKNIVKGITVGIDEESINLTNRMRSLSNVIKNSVTTINNNDGGLHVHIGQMVNNSERGVRDLATELDFYRKQRKVTSK